MEMLNQTARRETPPREDWLYLSARLRTKANALIDREGCRRLCEAQNEGEVRRLLAEMGFGDGSDPEAAFEEKLREAFALAIESAPDPAAFALFRYPYDCHNIKVSLKHLIRAAGGQASGMPGALFDGLGMLAAEKTYACVRDGEYDPLPPHMGRAVPPALAAYNETADPGRIDRMLDVACFADMQEAAAHDTSGFFAALLALQADGGNFTAALRLLRRGQIGAPEALSAMLLPGGSADCSLLAEACALEDRAEAEKRLLRMLNGEAYESVRAAFAGGVPGFAEVERALEEARGEFVRRAADEALYGPQVAAWYVMAVQTEEKNLRVILSGKRAGLRAEDIRARLRAH